MATMSKSFLFYLKNWDVMENLYATDEEIENIEISEKQNEMIDDVGNAADNYAVECLEKIRERFCKKHLESINISFKIIKNKHGFWDRDIFVGRNEDDIKGRKWRLSFYIRKYKESVCVLSFIVRFAGKTMTLKKEIDAIINTSIKDADGEIYNDCTHLAFVELPTDWKKETDDEPIIEEIVRRTIQALPKEKLNQILSLD